MQSPQMLQSFPEMLHRLFQSGKMEGEFLHYAHFVLPRPAFPVGSQDRAKK